MALPEQREAEIRSAIDAIDDPCSTALGRPVGLNTMGVVRAVDMPTPGHVTISLVLTDPVCPYRARFEAEITRVVQGLDGISTCDVEVADEIWWPDMDPRFRSWTSRPLADRVAGLSTRQARPNQEGEGNGAIT